jgi:hypothetical protein
MVSGCWGVTVSRCRGVAVSRCRGVMVSWCQGVGVLGCHGVDVPNNNKLLLSASTVSRLISSVEFDYAGWNYFLPSIYRDTAWLVIRLSIIAVSSGIRLFYVKESDST